MEPTLSEFTIMFSIATIGMVVLAMAIVFFVLFYQRKMLESKLKQQQIEAEHQQKMLQATLESQENERQRLAADLHDSIGAMLSTVRISMLTAVRNENANAEGFHQVKEMIDETIDSVRRISRDLMPSTLQKFGLTQAVNDMCRQYMLTSGIKIDFEKLGEEQPLAKSKEIIVFRIIQELINNSMKHSKSNTIAVCMNWNGALNISVEDFGIGFNVEEKKVASSGLGLFNIQNRAKIAGASFHYDSNRVPGTKAIITLPMA